MLGGGEVGCDRSGASGYLKAEGRGVDYFPVEFPPNVSVNH